LNKIALVKQKLLLILLVLTAGAVNYYLFRPDILLFRMLGASHAPLHLPGTKLQLFFSAYFSDIAWCIAVCLAAEVLSLLSLLHVWGKLLILCLPLLLETAQFFKLIPGTFDWIDIGIYALITFFFSCRIFKVPRHDKF
jgi:hypothetical protein